jgi:trk system potassium uptake protein TrkA
MLAVEQHTVKGGAGVHVVIMGCGRVGSTLAQSLESRGHTVAVIDQNGEAFRRLGADFQGLTVTGTGDRVVARIYDAKRAEVYERLGIPTVATVRWTADRMLRHIVRDDMLEVWRDPTSTVSIVEVSLAAGWIGRPVRAIEDATGARVAYVMRFGKSALPTPSMALQDSDHVYMLVTDDIAGTVRKITAAPPEERH